MDSKITSNIFLKITSGPLLLCSEERVTLKKSALQEKLFMIANLHYQLS